MHQPIHIATPSSAKAHRAVRVTLLAAALALAGCSSSDGSGGARHAGASPLPPAGTPTTAIAAGPLEGALKNTGGAVDNAVNLGLEDTLGGLGKQLDGPLKPIYDTVESTTQGLGAQTGLGEPVDGILKQAGGTVAGIGNKLGESGLPGGLDQGAGALVTGVGGAVASAGGLLNESADNPHPLAQTLTDATGGVRGLTRGLTDQNGLLEPLGKALDVGSDGEPILQPALANAGQAVDQVLPLGLQQPLGSAGKTLDGVVSPVGFGVTQVTQTVGDGVGLGAPVDQLLTSLGGNLQQAAGGIDAAVPLGLNGAVSNLGAAISSSGGLVHKTPNNSNPLGKTLDHATEGVVALTTGLGVAGGQGDVLGGVLGGDLLGGNGSALEPVISNLGSLGGVLGGDQAADSAGPLAPLTGLLGGGDNGNGASGGLIGGLLGGLGGK